MPKLQQSGKSYHVYFPKEYILLTGWKKGQTLVFSGAGKDKLIIEAVKGETNQ